MRRCRPLIRTGRHCCCLKLAARFHRKGGSVGQVTLDLCAQQAYLPGGAPEPTISQRSLELGERQPAPLSTWHEAFASSSRHHDLIFMP